jgi:hypothetical protein
MLNVTMPYRRRRFTAVFVIALVALAGVGVDYLRSKPPLPVINGATTSAALPQVQQQAQADPTTNLAGNILETLPVKGRAPKTGYKRTQFSNGWAESGTATSRCDVRNIILGRDLVDVVYRSPTDCTVMSGTLTNDPYTGKTIAFTRGAETSSVIQIDHVVALSNAWQTGAQQLNAEQRHSLANDPLELLAVDGPANNQKGDGDAATWLPSNKDYRCRYVARQIAVKQKYSLWVTEPERNAMRKVLASCPQQAIPVVTNSP